MSKKLAEVMNRKVLKEGTTGKMKLAMLAGVGERMIGRYIDGLSSPSTENAYKLALECGCTETEALKISTECDRRKPRAKTA